ncbi:MAG: PAS domain S-box protein [Nitrospirota bacterium]
MKNSVLDILSASIRAKMFLFISLLIIIVMVTFFMFTDLIGIPFTDVESDYAEQFDEAVTKINQIADVRKDNIYKQILSLTSNIEAFVSSSLTKWYTSSGVPLEGNQEFNNYLESYRRAYNIFHHIQMADVKSGKVIASTRTVDIGRDVSYEFYISGAIKSRCYYVCFAFDRADGDTDLYISHVIDVDSQPRYVIIMSVSASDFFEALNSNSQRGDNTESVLADNDGRLLINLKHTLPDGSKAVPLQYKISSPIMARALDAAEGTIVNNDYRGVTVLAAYRYIPINAETGWALVVKRDYSDVLAPYYNKLRYVVVLIICYLLAALILTHKIVKWLTRPILILKKAACAIGSGNLDTVVTVNTKDELGQLANTFNKMVTDLKDNQAELNRRREFLQKVLDNTTNAVYSIDLSGNFLLTNYKVTCITGYSKDELMGRSFSTLFDDDMLPQVREQFIKVSVHGERVVNYETELLRKDEVKRIINISIAPIYDNEKIDMIVGTAEDITHRRELEYQIKQSETRLRAIFDQSPIGIAIIESIPKRFIMINQSYCSIVGYSHEEMLGRTFVEITHPEDIESDLANMERLMEGEIDRFTIEKRYIRKDGSVVWVNLTCVPLWVSGEAPICHLAIVEDITEQKEIEEIRRLNEKRLEIMVQLNQFTDKPANEIMDYALEKSIELTGSTIGFISFGNENETEYTAGSFSESVMKECTISKTSQSFSIKHSGLWGEAVRQRKPVIVNDYDTTTLFKRGYREGHVPLKNLMLVPTFDINRIVMVTAVGNKAGEYTQADVSQLTILMDGLWQHLERKRLADELRQLNQKLIDKVIEETQKRQQGEQLLTQQSKMAAMGEMISLIAHQWKQPLNVISVSAQDLGDAYAFGELNADYLSNIQEIIVKHVEFMVNTVDDFRKFLRPSKEKVLFDVKKAIEELVGMFLAYFVKDCISINIISEEAFSSYNITGYPNEFKQVILNIINNARDAILSKRSKTQSVGGSDKIDINISNDSGEKIIIAISDTGGGIPDDIIERVFEAHFTTKPLTTGTGIGLYMSKTIIETNMGWKLTVRNIEGGAEFKIEI